MDPTDSSADTAPQVPSLPDGQHVTLPGRGTTYYREVAAPPGAATVILLHGWTATADLNWFTCYAALGEHFRVIALDQRGHGRGIRSSSPFRLSDCADDVAALADQLGIGTFIPVGYSMGGAVAQLMWRRHDHRVRGLVLCATSGYFARSRRERMVFMGMRGLGAVARVVPRGITDWASEQLYLQRKTMMWEPWAVQQAASNDWRHILEAGADLGEHDSRPWLPAVDVPTAVLVTTRDRVVSTRRQELMASLIPGASVRRIDADHDAVFAVADRFVPELVGACREVSALADVRAGLAR